MLMQDDTAGRGMSAKDKRVADVLWNILLLTRLVIPAYALYALYLYWTSAPSAYLTGGY